MIPEPKFQVNSTPWDVSDFNVSNIISALKSSSTDYGEGLLPTSFYDLDNDNYNPAKSSTFDYPGVFYPKRSYFYTSASGIRDFFVESDVLVDFRDKGSFNWQQYYSKYSYNLVN